MLTWTSEQVASLAPDAASVSAARGLASPAMWSSTGHDDRALWGRIRSYDVAVDLAAAGFSCSCPSRKVPCKHALGLLLLWAVHPEAVAAGEPPPDVVRWLAGRADRAARAGEHKEVDREAQARRVADRAARVTAGMEELDLWLRDLVRQGLAAAQHRPYGYWDEVAARMVDAQAPGAAGQIRRMAGIVRSGEGWPGRLLAQAGRLHLLTRAWARFDTLDPATQADARTAAGWSWSSQEVLAGAAVRDRWQVLGRAVVEEERYRIQRTWLLGAESGRAALILESVPAFAPLPAELVPGTEVDADLAFFPGAWPQRALVARVHGAATSIVEWHGVSTIGDGLADHARALAANPWVDRLPLVLSDVVPVARDDGWWARDASGAAVRLQLDDAQWWTLAALSGGTPVGLVGEWQDLTLRPLAVWADRRLVPLL
jgi:SWIM zinc finger